MALSSNSAKKARKEISNNGKWWVKSNTYMPASQSKTLHGQHNLPFDLDFDVSRRRRVSGNWPALGTDGSLTRTKKKLKHTRSKLEPKQNLSAIV